MGRIQKYGADQTGDSLLFLTTTKLTGNEFYCCKIEALKFFTVTWFNFEPSSRHLHLFYR